MSQLNKQFIKSCPEKTPRSIRANRLAPPGDEIFQHFKSAIRDPQSAIRSFFFFLFTFYFLLLVSCEKNTTPVTPPAPQLTLTIEDVAVTEAWLTLAVEDRSDNLHFALLRDDSVVSNGQLTTDDTALYDPNLLPAHTYTYRAELQKEGQKIVAAGPLSITTMDTTSHNFTWQIDTIGDGNSSVLRDVFIINENEIWAVGEIYLKDSTGNFDPEPYGAVHWDGIKWEILKVPYRRFGTNNILPGALKAIYGFNSSDIYVASSAVLLKKNGQVWEEKAFFMTGIPFNGQVTKIWGSSESNLYCVGNNGAIYHSDGQSWSRIAYGLEVDMHDIWGATDPQTGDLEILVVGSNGSQIPQAKLLLRLEGLYVKTVPDNGLPKNISSTWFKPGKRYYIVGDGAYSNRKLGEVWQQDTTQLPIYKDAIRGNDINDIIIAGSFGLVSHFNGMNWYHYTDAELPSFYGRYHAVCYKENIVAAVGWIGGKAITLRGHRN